jgi:hypothetical protein
MTHDFWTEILIVECGILATMLTLVVIASVFEYVYDRFNPNHPMCSIDPRCHPAFAWGNDGYGHIMGHTLLHIWIR